MAKHGGYAKVSQDNPDLSRTWYVRSGGLVRTWVSSKVSVPGANQVLLDTGPLPVGEYDFEFNMLVSDNTAAGGRGMIIEHRNSANTITLQNLGGCSPMSNNFISLTRYVLNANERIRIISGTAAAATGAMYVAAIGYRLT